MTGLLQIRMMGAIQIPFNQICKYVLCTLEKLHFLLENMTVHIRGKREKNEENLTLARPRIETTNLKTL